MPMKRQDYPDDWGAIRGRVLARAGNCCEGSPAYPDCRVANHSGHPVTGASVVLTCGHLDHDVTHNDMANLRAWCQRCHLTYDAAMHAHHAATTRQRRPLLHGQLDFGGTEEAP